MKIASNQVGTQNLIVAKKEKVTFFDRLGYLVFSVLVLASVCVVAACFWSVRGIAPGTVLDAIMVNHLTTIRIFAVPAVAVLACYGLRGFYRALKE